MTCLGLANIITAYSPFVCRYGGDGRTTFALPDLRGSVPIHVGNGPGLSPRAQGSRAGAEAMTLTQQQMPSHTHTIRVKDRNGNYYGGAETTIVTNVEGVAQVVSGINLNFIGEGNCIDTTSARYDAAVKAFSSISTLSICIAHCRDLTSFDASGKGIEIETKTCRCLYEDGALDGVDTTGWDIDQIVLQGTGGQGTPTQATSEQGIRCYAVV